MTVLYYEIYINLFIFIYLFHIVYYNLTFYTYYLMFESWSAQLCFFKLHLLLALIPLFYSTFYYFFYYFLLFLTACHVVIQPLLSQFIWLELPLVEIERTDWEKGIIHPAAEIYSPDKNPMWLVGSRMNGGHHSG